MLKKNWRKTKICHSKKVSLNQTNSGEFCISVLILLRGVYQTSEDFQKHFVHK